MIYELSPNYVPLFLLPLKVGGHVPPAPMGAPPMYTNECLAFSGATGGVNDPSAGGSRRTQATHRAVPHQ